MAAALGVDIEARGRCQHDGGAIVAEVGEEPFAEFVAVVNGQIYNGVESALGFGAEASGDGVDAFDDDVAAFEVFGTYGVEIVLRGIDGGFAEDLAEGGRRETCLSEAHGDGIDLGVAGDEAAHAGAAGAVALGDGVEEDDVVLQAFELHDAEVFEAVVAELAIDLVGKEVEVVLLDDVSNLEELFFGVEVARGVVGVADHDGLGVGGDGLLELLDGRQCEAALDVAGDGLDLSAAEFGEGVVVGVVRFGDDDFVVGVEADGEGELQGLAAAVGDDDLVGGHLDAMTMVVLAEFLAIGHIAGAVAVGEDADLGLSEDFESALGGLDIGLADVEVIDMDATFFCCISEGDEFADCRLREFVSFSRNLGHSVQV